MKRINLPLWTGAAICLIIVIFMALPDLFAAKSPYTVQIMRSWIEDGKLEFDRAPFPPSADSVLGTDDHGRDIWSLIVHGTRLTIFLGLFIVLGRFIIALPLALAAGFGNSLSKSIIKQFGILFSAIPALLISIIVLKQDLFAGMDKIQSIVAFVIVLSFVGWAKLGILLMERTENILRQPYIRSEIAIGKRRFHIAMENVIPHLASELVVLFFMEIARALSILMQLGIFGVFVGALRIIRSTDEGVISVFNTSFEPEWASMLGTAGNVIYSAPWMLLFPALAFFISVLGFNLLGEGLRTNLQNTDSGFIPALRRILRFDLRSLWRTATTAAKVRVVVLTAALLAMVFLPSVLQAGRYEFEADAARAGLDERVLIGTEAASRTAGLIRDRMQHLGIEPLKDDGYFFDYEIWPASIPVAHEFAVHSEQGDLAPRIGTDFSFVSLGSFSRNGQLYDATRHDMLNIDNYEVFSNRFVLMDKAYYSDASIQHIVDELGTNSPVKGILLIARNGESLTNSIGDANDSYFVLLVSRPFAGKLLEARSPVLSISATIEELGSTGRNVAGIFPGRDPALSDEAIFIGLGYNYADPGGGEALLFNLELMERICTDFENRRSFIFAFLDGTLKEEHHGIHSIMDHFPYNSSDIEVYLDLTGVRSGTYDAIVYSSVQAPITRYYAWSFGRLLEQQLNRSGAPLRGLMAVNRGGEYYFPDSAADNVMFWGNGIATIVVGTEPGTRGAYGLGELGGILLKAIDMNNY